MSEIVKLANLHLIKQFNTINTFENNSWTESLLSEPLTQTDFETKGMTDLNPLATPTNKCTLEMTNQGTLGEGKVVRRILDLTSLPDFNSITVRGE